MKYLIFALILLISSALLIQQDFLAPQTPAKTCLQSPDFLRKMPQKTGFFLFTTDSVKSVNSPYSTAQDNAKDKKIAFNYRLANTPQLRSYGFQFSCPETIANTQILFQFDSPMIPNFHMNNVEAALDIAFINSQGFIIDILAMETYKTNQHKPLYKPSAPALYALEARLGFFAEMEVAVGDQVLLP